MSGSKALLNLRLVSLSALAFVLMLSYAIARPATESLFLESHGSAGLPLAWILVAATAFAVVAVYGRLVIRMDLLRLYGGSSGVAGLTLLALLGLRAAGLPGADYALYVWKDLYVVVLVEAFYTYTNTVFPIATARWAYGLFGLLSSLGSVAGNLLVGVLARSVGSDRTLLMVVPLLVLMGLACVPLARRAGARAPADTASRSGSIREAAVVVRGSSYLLLVLLLIGVVQVVITLVDLEFNAVVEEAFPDTDRRTAVIGQVYAAVSVGTVVLHSLTGPLLRLAGVPLVLLAVPMLLGAGLVLYLARPGLLAVALVKGASKVFDYTIFRAAKEILYIPLSYIEKTLGKSVVDVLTYRLAKGAISLVLFGIGLVTAVRGVALPTALALVLAWLAVTIVIVRRFRARVSRSEEGISTSGVGASSPR